MQDNIIHLNKINIKEYQNEFPDQYLIIRRISDTEGYLVCTSPNRLSKIDVYMQDVELGFDADTLEIVPALIPNIGFPHTLD